MFIDVTCILYTQKKYDSKVGGQLGLILVKSTRVLFVEPRQVCMTVFVDMSCFASFFHR